MNNTERLEYTFLRTEADNQITLFLAVDPLLIGKTLDLQLTHDKKLHLSVIKQNNNISEAVDVNTNPLVFIREELELISEELENVLYEHLIRSETLLIFCDKDANILSEQKIPSFNVSKRMKP